MCNAAPPLGLRGDRFTSPLRGFASSPQLPISACGPHPTYVAIGTLILAVAAC
jgi:hypothetical protein